LERRKRIVGHRAANFKEAEVWNLEFWQKQTPEQRLSALVAIHEDVSKVQEGCQTKHSEQKEGS
jgi:hypothetical protein